MFTVSHIRTTDPVTDEKDQRKRLGRRQRLDMTEGQ